MQCMLQYQQVLAHFFTLDNSNELCVIAAKLFEKIEIVFIPKYKKSLVFFIYCSLTYFC